MPHGPDPDPLATADRLATALDAMTTELRTVTKRQAGAEQYARRNRAMIWLTAASIALDVVLTVLLVFAYGSAENAATRAAANSAAISAQHQNLLASCQSSNTSRAAQVTLWDHVLSETATNLSLKTPTGRQLLTYIRVAFKPRDCQALYRLP